MGSESCVDSGSETLTPPLSPLILHIGKNTAIGLRIYSKKKKEHGFFECHDELKTTGVRNQHNGNAAKVLPRSSTSPLGFEFSLEKRRGLTTISPALVVRCLNVKSDLVKRDMLQHERNEEQNVSVRFYLGDSICTRSICLCLGNTHLQKESVYPKVGSRET
jgi:hypothetical protein